VRAIVLIRTMDAGVIVCSDRHCGGRRTCGSLREVILAVVLLQCKVSVEGALEWIDGFRALALLVRESKSKMKAYQAPDL
jgi:hypothetical protein